MKEGWRWGGVYEKRCGGNKTLGRCGTIYIDTMHVANFPSSLAHTMVMLETPPLVAP